MSSDKGSSGAGFYFALCLSSSVYALSALQAFVKRRQQAQRGDEAQNENDSERRGDAEQFETPQPEAIMLVLAAGIGLLTGSGVTVFKSAIEFVYQGFYQGGFGEVSKEMLSVVPALGGALVCIISVAVATRGGFSPGIKGSFEEIESKSPFYLLNSVSKTLAAIVTLGTGNSLGPEGKMRGCMRC